MQRFFLLLLVSLVNFLSWQPLALANNIEIPYAQIETAEDGYRLNSSANFELTRELEATLMSGIALYFVTEVEITHPRWYWLDEKTVSTAQNIRLSYNVLTRQYRASINSSFSQNYKDIDEALALIRHPSRWVVAEKNSLSRGSKYDVAVRVRLDTSQLPKTLQFNAINNSDWRLASEWKRFSFRADEK